MTWQIGAEASGPGEITVILQREDVSYRGPMSVPDALRFIGTLAAAVVKASETRAPGFERGAPPTPTPGEG